MRTFTTEHKVYNFDELSETAQERAIEDHAQFVSESWDGDYILDQWKERLEDLGYNDPDISYNGFYSQGDGTSFTASSIDLKKFMKRHKLGNKYRALYIDCDNLSASVDRLTHHYYHENTVAASIEGSETDKQMEQQDIIEGLITEEVRELSRKIYDDLQEEYLYVTSKENIIENIETNEYEFTEDGLLV